MSLLWANGWAARLWAKVPSATRVSVCRKEFALGRGRPALRVAFLSDLHVGPTTPIELLENAVDEVRAFEPELLLLGGDYVFLDATPDKVTLLESLISRISAPTKIGVLGNHDLWTWHERIEAGLKRAGVKVCINEGLRLPAPHDDVAVFGLDEPWTGAPNTAQLASTFADTKVRIAVAHSPDGLSYLADSDAHLLVCGHTHGGHIALPGGRPIVLPPGPFSKKLPWGFHEHGKLCVFVSRGLGATEMPVRFAAPPDIGLFTFT
jgi:predicted MPP superfamily phosphohydrolase